MADKKISQLTGATTPLAGTEVLPIVQGGSTVKVAVSDLTAGRAVTTGALTVESGTGYQEVAKFKTASSTATENAGGGFAAVSSATAGSREAYVWLDADGANFSGGDYFYIQKKGNSGDAYIWQQSASNLIFGTSNADRGRFDTSGNFKVENGNVVVGTAAKGIDFSANTHAAGMTSELLDWYEEGTFTPTLTTTGGAFDSVTYDAITGGRYTRIGNMVHFQLSLRTDAVTVGAVTGDLIIGGLPFAAVANSGSTRDGNSAVSIGYAANFSSNEPMNALVAAGGTTIALYDRAAINGNTTAMDQTDVGTGANANEVWIAGSYICA